MEGIWLIESSEESRAGGKECGKRCHETTVSNKRAKNNRAAPTTYHVMPRAYQVLGFSTLDRTRNSSCCEK
jgi:hypothetical protein